MATLSGPITNCGRSRWWVWLASIALVMLGPTRAAAAEGTRSRTRREMASITSFEACPMFTVVVNAISLSNLAVGETVSLYIDRVSGLMEKTAYQPRLVLLTIPVAPKYDSG